MALSELSLHNAIRTYARQQQTGWALRVRRAFQPTQPLQEQIALSNEALNLQQIWQVAAELVERLHRGLSPRERLSLATVLEQEARVRYVGRLQGEVVPADRFERWIRSLHAAGSEGYACLRAAFRSRKARPEAARRGVHPQRAAVPDIL